MPWCKAKDSVSRTNYPHSAPPDTPPRPTEAFKVAPSLVLTRQYVEPAIYKRRLNEIADILQPVKVHGYPEESRKSHLPPPPHTHTQPVPMNKRAIMIGLTGAGTVLN